MIRALVDTNVLIDFLARRQPFYSDARRLMAFAYMGDYELWMSASQVTDIFYILSHGGRKSEADAARAALRALRQDVRVYAPGEDDVDAAIDSAWPDFEDALVYQAAARIGARVIVTRDGEGLSSSPIRALDVPGFFEWMQGHMHVAYEEIRF